MSTFLVKGAAGFNSDFEMWHRRAINFPMVMMSPWPVFWRMHEAQESQNNRQNPIIPLTYLQLSEAMLQREDCPLSPDRQEHHVRRAKRKTARNILYGFKRHGVGGALRMKRHSNRSWTQLFKNAFS